MASLLPKTWEIPEIFRRRLGDSPGSQRTMVEEGHLLLVLHDVPGAEGTHRTAALFWRDVEGNWKSSPERGGLGALNALIDRYATFFEELDTTIDSPSDASALFEVLKAVTPGLRSARNLKRALQTAREAAGDDRRLLLARDRAVDLERTAELVHGEAKNALEFVAAERAEEQAESSAHAAKAAHRLNRIAALFLPLTAVASIFGMNLPSGIGDSPWVFWSVIAGSFFLGLFTHALVNKGR